MTRDQRMQAFVASAGWHASISMPLAGDASGRRYARLTRPEGSAVLMDAPPALGQDTRPFIRIARHLSHIGLSAPKILAADEAQGFLLLEDLGDGVFARLMQATPETERMLYEAAIDALAEMQSKPVPEGLASFTPSQLAGALDIVLPWYGLRGPDARHLQDFARLRGLTHAALEMVPPEPNVLALRDFHAENLIWLPERTGTARVGLLDFQDAFCGPAAYDLVSLLEDARRDVAAPLRAVMIARFARRTDRDPEAVRLACAVLGAQRNLRILGVFARLSRHAGKPQYAELLPRVWGYLQDDLAHPALAALAAVVQEVLPAPTPDHVARLQASAKPDGDRPDAVMLFAAGFGTRMGDLTRDRPKPLIEVAGRPLLDHALDLTAAAGLPRRVVNTHYHAAQVARHLAARPDVLFSHEAPEILETGGGLRRALPLLGNGPVFTMNTDSVWTGANPFAQLRAAWDPDRMDAVLLLVPRARATGHAGAGDFQIAADRRLTRGPGAVYSGAQILRTDLLEAIPDPAFSLNQVWDRMLSDGRLFGCIHAGGWCDVGRPESIALAETMLAGAADG